MRASALLVMPLKDDQIRLVDEAVKAFGQVDVFVNNAGLSRLSHFGN